MKNEMPLPNYADVLSAARQITGGAWETPLIENEELNTRAGVRVLLKLETLQRTGSFKVRGAFNRVSRISAQESPGGIVAYSGGNHAQGAAYAAAVGGMPALIMMPSDAPTSKIERTRRYGAEIEFYPREDSHLRVERAEQLASEREATVVPSYDDFHVIAGQGTVGLEIFHTVAQQGVVLDGLVVPCSGGGLTAGCALATRALSPSTKIYAVEPYGFDDTARSIAAGQLLENAPGGVSICDALLISPPGVKTFSINRHNVDAGLCVTDREVAFAMLFAFEHLKIIVEPGGAVGLAAVLFGKIPDDAKTVAVVLTGGNIDLDRFNKIVKQQSSSVCDSPFQLTIRP
uniref:threonine ammonia-lyase n=1 Tax=Vreelandella venusta TaxID=44935 RepID=UPI0015555377|nr:threonine/serine dehydratase [Halomonas hydrothermalis]